MIFYLARCQNKVLIRSLNYSKQVLKQWVIFWIKPIWRKGRGGGGEWKREKRSLILSIWGLKQKRSKIKILYNFTANFILSFLKSSSWICQGQRYIFFRKKRIIVHQRAIFTLLPKNYYLFSLKKINYFYYLTIWEKNWDERGDF